MDLVEKAFLSWQRINQPRRFRQSVGRKAEVSICALSRNELKSSKATSAPLADNIANNVVASPQT